MKKTKKTKKRLNKTEQKFYRLKKYKLINQKLEIRGETNFISLPS